MINLKSLNSWIFLICNIALLFKEHFTSDRVVSLSVTLICVIGIIYTVCKSITRPISKTVIIILYMIYLIICFVL